MIRRTNLALGVGVALYFLPHVQNEILFFVVVIASSLIPDIDNFLFPNKIRIINAQKTGFFKKILRTYLTPIIISLVLAFFYPILALPVFLGYSFTLSLETFSSEGIHPFWPISKKKSSGRITPGGKIDATLFYIFVLFDIALLIKLFL